MVSTGRSMGDMSTKQTAARPGGSRSGKRTLLQSIPANVGRWRFLRSTRASRKHFSTKLQQVTVVSCTLLCPIEYLRVFLHIFVQPWRLQEQSRHLGGLGLTPPAAHSKSANIRRFEVKRLHPL